MENNASIIATLPVVETLPTCRIWQKNRAPFAVDGVDDGPPRLHLLGRPDARRVRVALRGGGHTCALGDEEAAPAGALRVVDGGVRLRHVAVGAEPRHRREHHSVGELELPHPVWRHQRDYRLISRRLLLRHFAASERACSSPTSRAQPQPQVHRMAAASSHRAAKHTCREDKSGRHTLAPYVSYQSIASSHHTCKRWQTAVIRESSLPIVVPVLTTVAAYIAMFHWQLAAVFIFSLTLNQHQPPASQQYFSFTANQYQPPATSYN